MRVTPLLQTPHGFLFFSEERACPSWGGKALTKPPPIHPLPPVRGAPASWSLCPRGHATLVPLCTHALSTGVQSPHSYDALVCCLRCSSDVIPQMAFPYPFLKLFAHSQMNPFPFVHRFITVWNFLAHVFVDLVLSVYNYWIVIFRRAEILSTFAITRPPSVVLPHMHPFRTSVPRFDLFSAGNGLLFPQSER